MNPNLKLTEDIKKELEPAALKEVEREPAREEEAEDERIMRRLKGPDGAQGEEWGTDESLNDGSSALSDTPSNGKRPKHYALSE